MLTASAQCVNPLEELLETARTLSGAAPSWFTALSTALLPEPPDNAALCTGRSGLNYDATPIQFCIGSSEDGLQFRILADPALNLAIPLERYRASLSSMHQVVALTASGDLLETLQRTLLLNLPSREDEMEQYPEGVMWLAASLNGPGCAMYIDARRGGSEIAYDRARAWMTAVAGDTADVDLLMNGLQNERLLCLGNEGVSRNHSRAKFYWRLRQLEPLRTHWLPGFRDEAFCRFTSLCMETRFIRTEGLVFSAGVHPPTGRLADCKLDVCCCRNCLHYSADEAVRVCDSITREFGLASVPLSAALEQAELAFLGFGVDSSGALRLNVYLKQRPGQTTPSLIS